MSFTLYFNTSGTIALNTPVTVMYVIDTGQLYIGVTNNDITPNVNTDKMLSKIDLPGFTLIIQESNVKPTLFHKLTLISITIHTDRGQTIDIDDLRTLEDLPLPPNTVDELRRDMARLAMVCEQIKALEQARLANLERAPGTGPHAMVRLIANVIGVGIETADMLVHEVLSRNLRDRRAVARFAGLTGAPNESGSRRRERGLAKSGNARVRRGLIQLAWRFLRFQKDSALAQWYRVRTEGPAAARRTKMIVALARKLLIAFWRMVTVGEIPAGFALRQPA